MRINPTSLIFRNYIFRHPLNCPHGVLSHSTSSCGGWLLLSEEREITSRLSLQSHLEEQGLFSSSSFSDKQEETQGGGRGRKESASPSAVQHRELIHEFLVMILLSVTSYDVIRKSDPLQDQWVAQFGHYLIPDWLFVVYIILFHSF